MDELITLLDGNLICTSTEIISDIIYFFVTSTRKECVVTFFVKVYPLEPTLTDIAIWLSLFPNIKHVSRDGSLTYAAAIREAHHINDRFHLVKNLTEQSHSAYIKL
ncbi:hypothetical protein [Psychrobacillus sp. BM2]|uniref:hypothetical protein n=1 Tax=Psychrobacillus sp. BM2 TaxID=3400421 RepID=UPI003B028C85